jgi:hypothetical protein
MIIHVIILYIYKFLYKYILYTHMNNSNPILYIIYVFGAYTLYYTYQNDFNIFLLTFLLILVTFWYYIYINEFIDKFYNIIQDTEKNVQDKIIFLSQKLFNIQDLTQEKK